MSAGTLVTAAVDQRRSRGRSMLSLARVEAGHILRHPAFLLGLVVVVLAIATVPEDWVDGQFLALTQAVIVAMGIGTLIAAALVAGRQRFLSEPDLFPATPATRADRVLATALGLVGPAFAAAAVMAVVGVRAAVTDGFLRGSRNYAKAVTPTAAEWLQPAFLVLLAGVVGICVTQLPRGRLPVLIAVGAVFFVGGTAGVWAAQELQPLRVLHPVMSPEYEQERGKGFTPTGWAPGDAPLREPDGQAAGWRSVHFDTAAMAWHLVYLTGLIAVGVRVGTRMADRDGPPVASWLGRAGVPLLLVGAAPQIITAGGPS